MGPPDPLPTLYWNLGRILSILRCFDSRSSADIEDAEDGCGVETETKEMLTDKQRSQLKKEGCAEKRGWDKPWALCEMSETTVCLRVKHVICEGRYVLRVGKYDMCFFSV